MMLISRPLPSRRLLFLSSGAIFWRFSAAAAAATCRAGSAAEAGSQAGYERARAAATAWEQRESNVSSSLQSCLSRIKNVKVTLPQFPGLDEIISQLENKVCEAALDKVNEQIPDNIDPWKNFNS